METELAQEQQQRPVFLVTTCQRTPFQRTMLEASLAAIRKFHPLVPIVVLDDSGPGAGGGDASPFAATLPDGCTVEPAPLQPAAGCGEVNPYIWSIAHRDEYDLFIYLHDSCILLQPIPVATAAETPWFRPFWFSSRYIYGDTDGADKKALEDAITFIGSPEDTAKFRTKIHQIRSRQGGDLVFGSMAVWTPAFAAALATQTNFTAVASMFNTRPLRSFFERVLWAMADQLRPFGGPTEFRTSAICGDIFNHKQPFQHLGAAAMNPALAGNPFVLKVWQGR